MKALIIGSKGFIGSHLLNHLRNDKNNVVYGCDIVADYEDEKYFWVNPALNNFELPFKKQDFTVCINCSGAASVPDSLLNPLNDFLLNTSNVFTILSAIKNQQPSCKFINLSSAAVYGNPINLPITENHDRLPVSPYGVHKRMSEEICKEFYDHWEIKTCSLRIFSAYGPGLKKQLLWDLGKKAEQNSVELYGTGLETRDFIYIDDLILAIELVVLKGEFDGRSINIANGEQIKIKDLVKEFYSVFNYKGAYKFKGVNRSGDPLKWQADISHLKELGYQPKTSIEQGIKQYVLWFKEEK